MMGFDVLGFDVVVGFEVVGFEVVRQIFIEPSSKQNKPSVNGNKV
jgi:hypothetical protein